MHLPFVVSPEKLKYLSSLTTINAPDLPTHSRLLKSRCRWLALCDSMLLLLRPLLSGMIADTDQVGTPAKMHYLPISMVVTTMPFGDLMLCWCRSICAHRHWTESAITVGHGQHQAHPKAKSSVGQTVLRMSVTTLKTPLLPESSLHNNSPILCAPVAALVAPNNFAPLSTQ